VKPRRAALGATLAAVLVLVVGQSAAQEAAESPAQIAARAMALQKEGRRFGAMLRARARLQGVRAGASVNPTAERRE
jgi:hypothetical protein